MGRVALCTCLCAEKTLLILMNELRGVRNVARGERGGGGERMNNQEKDGEGRGTLCCRWDLKWKDLLDVNALRQHLNRPRYYSAAVVSNKRPL